MLKIIIDPGTNIALGTTTYSYLGGMFCNVPANPTVFTEKLIYSYLGGLSVVYARGTI